MEFCEEGSLAFRLGIGFRVAYGWGVGSVRYPLLFCALAFLSIEEKRREKGLHDYCNSLAARERKGFICLFVLETATYHRSEVLAT